MSKSRLIALLITSFVLLFTPLFFISIVLIIVVVKKNPDNKYIQLMPYVLVGLFSFLLCLALPNVNDIKPTTKDLFVASSIGFIVAMSVIVLGLWKVRRTFPQ